MDYNPETNPNVISIVRQEDGNYKGYTQKFGKLVEVREVKPEDCVVKLITHGGE
jgi:hypothetical protein